MDSPGFNAQYCTYTLIDNKTKDIATIAFVDKREVDSKSTNMEKLGFIKGVEAVRGARSNYQWGCYRRPYPDHGPHK